MASWGDAGSIKSSRGRERKPEPPVISFSQSTGQAPMQQSPQQPAQVVSWMGAGGFTFNQALGSPVIEARSPSGQVSTVAPGTPGYQEISQERDSIYGSGSGTPSTNSSGAPTPHTFVPPTTLPPNWDPSNDTTGSSVTIDPQFGPESSSDLPVYTTTTAPETTSSSTGVTIGAIVAIAAAIAAGLYLYYGLPKSKSAPVGAA